MSAAVEPAWLGACADPFAVRTDDGWVMYGTVDAPVEGRVFQVLRSADLVAWEPVGGALEPVVDEPADAAYWAPEVARDDDGTWVMHYSLGRGHEGHRLRVATATSAVGPFRDLGVELTPDLPFAIDPSPYRDPDGAWWLYYATDLLDGPRPGTGLVVQRMDGLRRLVGEPRVVLRAQHDWQRFEADREIYGGRYDWHTLEGPQVVFREGRHWLLYSGGNFQDESYAVGVAVADSPDGPWSEVGDEPLLRTGVAGLVGPGHCSVLPDGDRDLLVFHGWDAAWTRRQPYVVPLVWSPEGPRLELPGS